MPLWGRFIAILIGLPVIVELLRVVLEQWVSRLTAVVLILIGLIVGLIVLFWKSKSPEIHPPMSKEGALHEQREVGKLAFLLLAIMTLICSAGTVAGFYGAYNPGGSRLIRVVMGIIGVIGLLASFVCFGQARYEFLRLTWRRGQRPPPRDFSISYKAAFWIFVIIVAIVFVIAKLNK